MGVRKMNKVIKLLLVMVTVLVIKAGAFGEDITVSTFSELNAAISSEGDKNITLAADITSIGSYDNIGGGSKVLNGDNKVLNGGGNVGFNLGENKSLEIKDIKIENFGTVVVSYGSPISIKGDVTFSNNYVNAGSYASVLFCSSGSKTKGEIIINDSTATFSNNVGVIYCRAGSSISISGSSVTFSNNRDAGGGGAAIRSDSGGEITFHDSEVLFENNQAASAELGHDIYMSSRATINITGEKSKITISSGVASSTDVGNVINKSDGILDLGGDNSYYIGSFKQSGGETIVRGKYFTGISSITGGVLKFVEGSQASGGNIYILEGGTLRVVNSNTISLANISIENKGKFNIETNGQVEIGGDLTIEGGGELNASYGTEDKIKVGGNYNQR
jgi:hypothetical protein